VAEDASGIRAAIERDRAELASTVQALVERADVKERVRETVAEKTEALQQRAGEVGARVREATPEDAQKVLGDAAQRVQRNPVPLMLAGVFVLGMLVGRMRGRRHTG
jgi:hypothetical protein